MGRKTHQRVATAVNTSCVPVSVPSCVPVSVHKTWYTCSPGAFRAALGMGGKTYQRVATAVNTSCVPVSVPLAASPFPSQGRRGLYNTGQHGEPPDGRKGPSQPHSMPEGSHVLNCCSNIPSMTEPFSPESSTLTKRRFLKKYEEPLLFLLLGLNSAKSGSLMGRLRSSARKVPDS